MNNIPVDDEAFARIRELAKSTGRSVEEVAGELLATLAGPDIELDDEDAAAAREGFEQLDRGESVSEADVRQKLDALLRR